MFDSLTSEANDQLKTLFKTEDIGIDFTIPKDRQHGDLASAAPLRLAKMLGKPPKDIAKKIAESEKIPLLITTTPVEEIKKALKEFEV